MRDCIYDIETKQLENSWHCLQCGLPSFSSTLFHPTNAQSFNISDPSVLISTCTNTSQNSSLESDLDTDLPPLATSTPTNLSSKANTTFHLTLNDTPVPTSLEESTFTFPQPVDPNAQIRSVIINFQSAKKKDIRIKNLIATTKPQIIFGNETWLNADIYSSELFPPEYEVYRKDRKDGYGGVLLAIHKSLISSQINEHSEAEIIFASIETKDSSSPLIVGAAYRPPSEKSLDYSDNLFRPISSIMKKYHSSPIWIGGDFNLPDINWDMLNITGYQYPQQMNKSYLDHIQSLCLHQSVTEPTHKDNTLDIFLTNTPDLTEKSTVIPGLSDHDIPLIDSKICTMRPKVPRRKIYLWDKADTTKIKNDTHAFAKDFCSRHANSTSPDIETMYAELSSHLKACQETHVPSKMLGKKSSAPHSNKELRSLSRRKNRAWKRARKTNYNTDWDKYRQLRNETARYSRKAKSQFVYKATSEENKNKLYKYIKSKKTSSSGIPPLLQSGLTFASPQAKSDILNEQFCSAFTPTSNTPLPQISSPTGPDIDKLIITTEGVEKLMKNLKPNKATGPDNIPTRILSMVAKELAPAVTLIFQTSLDSGQIPSIWRHALVTPIFKKGDKKLPNNYRPISLTCHLCKLMEHIIRRSITDHLEHHNLISDGQYGFRKGRSCESQLIQVTHDLASAIDTNSQTDIILLDFEKAFDKVSHPHLIHKLKHLGISGNILNWTKSFLSDRTQQVLVDGSLSHIGNVTSGVPQGSVLGPTLFLVFINDITDTIQSTIRLFADDTILYRHTNKAHDVHILQEDLNRLEKWEETWQMSFNVKKCEHLQVTLKKNPVVASFKLHDLPLQKVDEAKYLGVTITNNLSWQAHINKHNCQSLKNICFCDAKPDRSFSFDKI